ncbi:MAG: hypothetical protein ACOX33_00030 [Dethiobacteria bacterium]
MRQVAAQGQHQQEQQGQDQVPVACEKAAQARWRLVKKGHIEAHFSNIFENLRQDEEDHHRHHHHGQRR